MSYKSPLKFDTGKKYIYGISIYVTLCKFSFEIKESSLSDTRWCITTLLL